MSETRGMRHSLEESGDMVEERNLRKLCVTESMDATDTAGATLSLDDWMSSSLPFTCTEW